MKVKSSFQSAGPVTGEDFTGRQEELGILRDALDDLKNGVRRLYCVLGPRKIGKTSLYEELTRRIIDDPDLITCRIDLLEANTPTRFFTKYSLSLLDSFIRKRLGAPILSGLIDDESALVLAAARLESHGIRSLNQALVSTLELIRGGRGIGRHYRSLLELPAELASETGMHPVVILDEFQEVLRFNDFKEVKESFGDILKSIRARWQMHKNVAYFISGSEVSLLQEMVESPGSPLFGHFIPINLGPFSSHQSEEFLIDKFAGAGLEFPRVIIEKLADITGGHPFYLQVLGEDMSLRARPGLTKERLFKETLQESLFSSTGRLYMHFSRMLDRYAGRSTTFQNVLLALTAGEQRVSAIARATGQQTGAVSAALKQLIWKDCLEKTENGRYRIRDKTFSMWLAGAHSARRTIAGPYYLGNRAERGVCMLLGKEGFNLVYHFRGSRGAFDLLALLGSVQTGLQVKSVSNFPFYLSRSENGRMIEWGAILGWIPVLVAYDHKNETALYFDVRRTGRELRKNIRFDKDEGTGQLLKLL